MCTSNKFRKRGPVLLGRLLSMVVGCMASAAGPAFGAPGGELDATFGENGRLTIHLSEHSVGWPIAQQPDGRLLVGGATLSDGVADFVVVRLNADGSRDNSFGTNGVVTVDFFGLEDVATNFAVQPDGKIVAAGWTDVGPVDVNYDFALVRLNPDGTVDNSFGINADGRVTLDLGGGDESISGMVLLDNGQIVVTGISDVGGDYDAVFARFNADGSLDATFGTNASIPGTTLVDSNGSHDQPFWLTRLLDGKFIGCGLSGPTPYSAIGGDMFATRVNADGSVDAGYGVNGVAIVETPANLGMGIGLTCVALEDGSGNTVLAGFNGDPGMADLALARLGENGTPVTTFGNGGQTSIDLGGTEIVQTIVLLSDGSLGLTGLTQTLDDNIPSDMYVARVDPDTGSLDPAFGNDGVTIVDFGVGGEPSMAEGLGLIEQADGKLVALGTSFSLNGADGLALARVDPNGVGSVGFAGFVETSATVAEGTANVMVTVRRTGGSTGDLTVDYSTVDGTALSPGDFTASSGTLTWVSGDVTPQTITIPITNDSAVENFEGFTIVLSNATGNALAASEVSVTVTDSDTAPPPPPGGGGGGGGGATGIELLALLTMLSAGALRRRRRKRG